MSADALERPDNFGLTPGFVARVRAKREAKVLAEIIGKAEAEALAHLDKARGEALAMMKAARAEAEAILRELPDFAAMEAADNAAYLAIRDVADRLGMPMARIVGRDCRADIYAARCQAVRAVMQACPHLSPFAVGALFKGLSGRTVKAMAREAK